MYVAPTPYGLLDGIAHHQTLIVPANFVVPDGFKEVGAIVRKEVSELVVKYAFNLKKNELKTEKVRNPQAGLEHTFRALRLTSGVSTSVSLRANHSMDTNPGDGGAS
ncbi:MAG: hypothetical protein Fur0022_44870 [Anaerolineales bacterium]